MGNSLPERLNTRSLGHLKNASCFSGPELRDLYKRFRDLTGGGYYLKASQFWEGLRAAGLYTNDDEAQAGRPTTSFYNSLFSALDHTGNKQVDLREFICGLSVFATNTLHDTLRITFDLYDIGGSEWITEAEMVEALMSMNAALELSQFSGEVGDEKLRTEEGIRAWVKKVFAQSDRTGNGKLGFEEFAHAVREHPLLVNLASAFITDCCHDFFGLPDRLKADGAGLVAAPSGIPNDVSGMPISEEQLQALFNRYDVDNNGFITKTEFVKLVKGLDDMGIADVEERMADVLKQYNAMGDDKLCYDEFCILMLKVAQW
eukprot:NODE_740_length_1223_cov_104.377737_g700_i0.p1 GENE.NODE_740_length_1223_cov_104.377737_g700_i0~~NODE_740_length_1223_cov_104.377737_g700_i0.p1  ORF type:complete len:317 (+),score=50.09 NODE_740_length_1223_cov_104.377737_g700_i0:67-1017(+)